LFHDGRVSEIAWRPGVDWRPNRPDRNVLWFGERSFYLEDRFGDLYPFGPELLIAVERQPPDAILARAIPRWQDDGKIAPRRRRQRWAVNHIRHRLTPYEPHLALFRKEIGVPDAEDAYRERVLRRIATVYPEFASEAERQIGEKIWEQVERRDLAKRAADDWWPSAEWYYLT
jgi:hypothetical protein